MRDEKLDFFKGLLIWSVVLGHSVNALCPNDNILHIILRTFDLPMFMYISGFLLRGSLTRYDWKQLVLNKTTNIIFPAIVWFCISLLIFHDRCFYYFLWAVFVSSVIVCFVNLVFKKKWMAVGVCLALILLFHLIPYNIINISFLFPFFLIGYYSKSISKPGLGKGLASLFIFIILLIFVWNPSLSIWNTGGYVLDNPLFMSKAVSIRLLIGTTGIYATIFLFGIIYDHIKDSYLVKLFVGIGKETLSLYLLQHIVVEICLMRLVESMDKYGFLVDNQNIIGFVGVPVVSFALLVGMYGLILLLNKSQYTKWLFGFRVQLSK